MNIPQVWLAPLFAFAIIGIAAACGASSVSETQAPDAEVDPAATDSQLSTATAFESGPVDLRAPTFAAKFSRPDEPKERGDLEIVTLLSRDAIPSIDSPMFVDVERGSRQMDDADLIIGVSNNGERKAYSTAFLSSHEIVNDVVGGLPVAVTW